MGILRCQKKSYWRTAVLNPYLVSLRREPTRHDRNTERLTMTYHSDLGEVKGALLIGTFLTYQIAT
jgi:hypothetical protein